MKMVLLTAIAPATWAMEVLMSKCAITLPSLGKCVHTKTPSHTIYQVSQLVHGTLSRL